MHAAMNYQRCFCGYLLRSETERWKGWCLECGIQRTFNLAVIDRVAAAPDLSIITYSARKATLAEQEAVTRLETQPSDEQDPAFYHAYVLCDALSSIAQAFTQWAYASAHLWALHEREENATRKTTILDFHHWGTEQFRRLFTIHLSMQARTQHFCKEQHILLTYQTLDLPVPGKRRKGRNNGLPDEPMLTSKQEKTK